MSATWDLKLGRRTIMWAKRYVPDELLLVFNDDDMFVDRPRAEALLDDTDDIEFVDADVPVGQLFSYVSTVKAIRSRLELQGFGPRRVQEHALRYLDGERDDSERYVPESRELFESRYAQSEELLEALLAQVNALLASEAGPEAAR